MKLTRILACALLPALLAACNPQSDTDSAAKYKGIVINEIAAHHENEELIYPLFPMADVVFAPVFQGVVYLFTSTLAAPNPDNIEQVYVNIHENEWHHEIHGRISYE